MDGLRERDYYRERIIEMVKEINNSEYLKKIFYYVQVPYKKEKEEI